jgi:hypothetical protein
MLKRTEAMFQRVQTEARTFKYSISEEALTCISRSTSFSDVSGTNKCDACGC